MKQVSVFIGVVMVLFLAAGAYAVSPAGDLTAFNGTWLKLTVKPQKGVEFEGYDSTEAPEKMKVGANNIYACMDAIDIAPYSVYLRFFDKEGTPIGHGTLEWDAGTNLEFLGTFEAHLANGVTYVTDEYGFPTGDDVTDTHLSGLVSVKGKTVEKVKIQSISGAGYIQAPDATETTGRYAGFGYILNGGFTKGEKMPQISPACGDMEFVF